MKATFAALASLLLASTALAAAPVQGGGAPGGTPQVPTIQEEGDFYILNFSEAEDENDRLSLQAFVNLCQEVTSRNFTYNVATGGQLKDAKLFMYGTKRIPKSDFYRFFQIMMFINDFVCVDVGPPHLAVTLIQGIGSRAGGARGASGNVKQKAQYVLPTDLQDYADQPATLITTVLSLPNTETRQLTTSLRGLFTETATESLLAVGDHSVLLQGFGSNIAALAQLLYIVDRESADTGAVQPVFEVLPLEYAAAEDVSDLLEELLEAGRRTGRTRTQRPDQQGVAGVLGGGDVEAKILVYARTNSLLIMAAPEEMPRIKNLVAQLDVDVIEPERNYHIYSLQNVNAEELADVLDNFLQDAGRVTGPAGGTGGRPGGAQAGGSSESNEIVVVPDPGTNSLLIAANKTRYEEVLELIRQLDRRQDQVLIETALIALQGQTFRDIGVELGGADLDEGFGVTSFGLSSITDSDGDGTPDLRIPNESNGLIAGILSGDDINIPFLIAAIENVDSANVLNVPSVLVNNNGSATVSTKDEQPTTTITLGSGVGGQTQENFNGYEEAGITLTISPSISASAYLRLDISLIVSTFLGTFQPGNPIPPARITREIATVVNVPDGDTMVVGGIITDNLTESAQQIPWLGDIPILGNLFKRDSKTSDRTTLYFFVTPHILRDRDFADLAEVSYRKKLEAAEVIGQDRIRMVDPEFGGGQDAVDLDGFQLPLYRSPTRGEVDAESLGLDPIRTEELLRGGTEEAPPGDAGSSDDASPADDGR
jgi:general secretion pathway protein D